MDHGKSENRKEVQWAELYERTNRNAKKMKIQWKLYSYILRPFSSDFYNHLFKGICRNIQVQIQSVYFVRLQESQVSKMKLTEDNARSHGLTRSVPLWARVLVFLENCHVITLDVTNGPMERPLLLFLKLGWKSPKHYLPCSFCFPIPHTSFLSVFVHNSSDCVFLCLIMHKDLNIRSSTSKKIGQN